MSFRPSFAPSSLAAIAVIANPAVGAELTWTAPSACRVLSLQTILSTSAAAGMRTPFLEALFPSGAALVISEMRALLRAFSGQEVQPVDVLSRANRCLCDDLPPGRFVTVFFGILDPARPRLGAD